MTRVKLSEKREKEGKGREEPLPTQASFSSVVRFKPSAGAEPAPQQR